MPPTGYYLPPLPSVLTLSPPPHTPQGMTESANVASVIFLTHMVTLTLLLLLGLIYALANTDIFAANMRAPFPDIDIVDTLQAGTVGTALFYGYSSVG